MVKPSGWPFLTPTESTNMLVPTRFFMMPSAIGERTEFQVQAKRTLEGNSTITAAPSQPRMCST